MLLSDYRIYGSAAERLERAIAEDMVSHAYIIEGDTGVDKEGFAKAFAKALLCKERPGRGCRTCPTCRKIDDENYEDMYIVRPGMSSGKKSAVSSIKDADLEELQSRLLSRPSAGDRNIAIISSAGSMTARAQTRILKTLEEPAKGTVIMLLLENSLELLPTINSRCVKIRLVSNSDGNETEWTGFAAELLNSIRKRGYFFDIKKMLDSKISSREDALSLLDAVEKQFSADMHENGAKYGLEGCSQAVQTVEDTKKAIRMNAGYNYAIRALVLKLEDII